MIDFYSYDGNRRLLSVEIMHIRKSRQPAQGHTNLNRQTTSLSQLPCMSQTQTNFWDQANSQLGNGTRFTANNFYTGKRASQKTKRRLNTVERLSEMNSSALESVRKAYRGKSNIWRIAKAWKFPEKGYIERPELKQQIKNSLGIDLSEKETAEMFFFFSGNSDKLDLEQFLSLIYSQPNQSIMKPKLYNVLEQKNERNQKILNLIHKIPEREEKNYQSPQIRENSTLVMKNKEKTKEKGEQFFSKTTFSTLLSNSDKKYRISSQKKGDEFNPRNFSTKNQQKTRFGATKQNLIQKIPTTDQNFFITTSSMMSQQNDDAKKKSNQYENKLQRMREYKRVQKQNILKIQKQEGYRSQANILKKRLEKQAYEYSAFIKNHWQ